VVIVDVENVQAQRAGGVIVAAVVVIVAVTTDQCDEREYYPG
tara:strand:+ start:16 stop:141 length:126 start_codon:yes stop_codon:yes gene_type:complete